MFQVLITWDSDTVETVSIHADLEAAASETFRLAQELSLSEAPPFAYEIGIYHDKRLWLSIQIVPGVPLEGRSK